MSARLQALLDASPVVTDGAWGTELQARGLPPGACPDAWNLTHPQRVAEVARDYAAAGSRVLLTNTFGANRIALARHNLAAGVPEINHAGVQISRLAGGDQACVFGSIGPTGSLLLSGDVSEAEMAAAFAEQAQALERAGVDALVVETMVDLAEAHLAVAAAAETGLPVVACMAFSRARGGYYTIMGVTPEAAAEGLIAAGAQVIGANCGLDAAGYVGLCGRLRAATDAPIWLKPNAGVPELLMGRAVHAYRTTPQEFARQATALAQSGADFIGGCCGTGPAFIRALASALGREPACASS